MDPKQMAEQFVLRTLCSEDLPAHAADALEEGFDSPHLRQLAGMIDRSFSELEPMFRKTLEELDISLPSLEEARLSYARRIASDIVLGKETPYAGARKIWWETTCEQPRLKELDIFVGLASEWEDDEKRRPLYEAMIVEESRKLLEGVPSSPET